MSEEAKDKKNILRLMEEVSSGEKASLEAFYHAFLESEFVIINRASQGSSPREPNYPNDLFPFLAVRGGDKTWLPIFSGAEAANEWSSYPVDHQTIKGSAVLDRVPNDWWLALNPGSEISKEFSPWEISTLRSGPEGIKAAAEDQMPSFILEQEYSNIKDSEFPGLIQSLKQLAGEETDIDYIKVAKESGTDADGKVVSERCLVGLGCKPGTSKNKLEEIRESFISRLSPLFIGGSELEVLTGIGESPLSLGMLKEFSPVYQRSANTKLDVTQIALVTLIIMYLILFALKI